MQKEDSFFVACRAIAVLTNTLKFEILFLDKKLFLTTKEREVIMRTKLVFMAIATIAIFFVCGHLFAVKGFTAEVFILFVVGVASFVWSGIFLVETYKMLTRGNRILRDFNYETGYEVLTKTYAPAIIGYILLVRDLGTGEKDIALAGKTLYPPTGFFEKKLTDGRIFLIPLSKPFTVSVQECRGPIFTPDAH